MAKGTENTENLIEEEIQLGSEPKYKNNADLLNAINKHLKNSDMPAMEQSDLDFYMNQERDKESTRAAEQQKKYTELSEKLKKLFINNTSASNELKDDLPTIKTAENEHMERLREEAEKTAEANAKKAEKRRINAARKKAQRELERINMEREKAELRAAGGQEVTDKDVKRPELESNLEDARGRHMFTSAANSSSWGTRDTRRGAKSGQYKKRGEKLYGNKYLDEGELKNVEFEDKNIGIRLNGARYTPTGEKSEKAVLVFLGTGHGANGTLDRIIVPYLEQGYTVYQFDYRGMGISHAIDKEGKEVKSSLSEKTMYQDGMAMYHHLTKTLGILPKNLVLHGYSHGAPIAAKVALEATKETQRDAILNGGSVKEASGLGGVVLHSPMKTLYDATVREIQWKYDEVPGIAAWSAVPGMFGKAFGGSYNTEQHMKDLAKIDKNIPVHFVSGRQKRKNMQGDYDHLNHEQTGLKAAIEKDFAHVTGEVGKGEHDSRNISDNNKYLQAIAQGREAFAAVSAAEKGNDAKAKEGGKKVLESEDKNLLIG